MQKTVKFLKKNYRQMAVIIGTFMVAGLLLNVNLFDFQANLLAGQKSAPFDGTVTPVKRVPNWVDLSTTEWKASYDQIPQNKFIELPEYIPSQLVIPMSSLNFQNSGDKAIRNAQVTFSTPYMGNYKLDGKEYAGSHLAVDIKIPTGTPIYAIANAVVTKAAYSSGGFGNHLVLRHDDVPSLNSEAVKTTYYSGYGHMSALSVNEGDLVSKGQLIGYSGNSGTTTTPHLHFQIDNDQAPWHPYWPYTSKEAADAGLSFWEAINAGLGKDKALATTVSPMAFVQKYENYNGSTSSVTTTNTPYTPPTTVSPIVNNVQPDELPPSTTNTEVPVTPVNVVSQPTVDVTPATPALASFELKHGEVFTVGTPFSFKVIALDQDGKIIEKYQPAGEVYLKIENGSATLEKSYLTAADFQNGVAEFKVTPMAEYGLRVSVTDGTISKVSDVLQAATFTDLSQNDENFVAINFLKNNEIVKGYPDGTFKPKNPVSRVEALKFIYEGLNKQVGVRTVLEFKDTDSKAWYARYIAAAQKEGIVKGYNGNIFKPANPVTRAEFIKMLMEASGFNGKDYIPLNKNFSDVGMKDWYYSYIGLAKDKNLLDTSTNLFRPNEQMTRAEVAQILYKTILMKATNGRKYENNMVVNADDISEFYRQV
jgi:murein DD-endopeptidase MepM/ murein hydrolase activator NlpD